MLAVEPLLIVGLMESIVAVLAEQSLAFLMSSVIVLVLVGRVSNR